MVPIKRNDRPRQMVLPRRLGSCPGSGSGAGWASARRNGSAWLEPSHYGSLRDSFQAGADDYTQASQDVRQ